MKTKFFMIAALAAMVGMASCAKDGGETTGKDDNVLVIKLPDNTVPATRVVEGAVATNSNTTLTDVTVFLLNGKAVVGDPLAFESAEITNKEKRCEQIPAAVNGVLLVANFPGGQTGTVATAVKALKNSDAIKAYAFDIAGQSATGITTKTLMGEGSAFVSKTDPDGSHDNTHVYKETEVTLDALTARFEVGAVKEGDGLESVELVAVWINNFYEDGSKASVKLYPSTESCWTTTPATNPIGQATAFGTITVPGYTPTQYRDLADNTNVTVSAGSQVYAYSVFAGANIPHVIMLVKGEYSTGYYTDSDKFFMGYVTFNKFDESTNATPQWITSIIANTIYKIGVGATGIKIDADMITDKPELQKTDLGIKVALTPWTEKEVKPGV